MNTQELTMVRPRGRGKWKYPLIDISQVTCTLHRVLFLHVPGRQLLLLFSAANPQ